MHIGNDPAKAVALVVTSHMSVALKLNGRILVVVLPAPENGDKR